MLVQRGWLPRDSRDRDALAAGRPRPPARCASKGRIAPPPARLYEFDGAASGAIRQNLDLAAFARETGLALRPLSVVQLTTPARPPTACCATGRRPRSMSHKHYGYAFQWFALSALITGLYVWFQLIRPRRRRPR